MSAIEHGTISKNHTISHGIAGVVESRNQPRYTKGGGQNAFLGSLRAQLRDGFEELQGVASRIEVAGLEQFKENGDVILPLA